jgi:hypothetical protein
MGAVRTGQILRYQARYEDCVGHRSQEVWLEQCRRIVSDCTECTYTQSYGA